MPPQLTVTNGMVADLVAMNAAMNSAPNPQLAVQLFTKNFGAPTTINAVTDPPNAPNFGTLSNGDYTVVCVGGVRTNSMYADVIAGWTSLIQVEGSAGWNGFAFDIAKHFFPDFGNKVYGSLGNLIFVGHSLGGMVCEALAWQMRQRASQVPSLILTTGTPRPLATYYGGEWIDCQRFRFMFVGDAIPAWPPRFEEDPGLVLTAAGFAIPVTYPEMLQLGYLDGYPTPLSVWPLFRQGPGGITLTAGGNSFASDEPPVPPSLLTASLDTRQAFIDSAQNGNHLISTYVSALYARADVEQLPPLPKKGSLEAPGPVAVVPQIGFIMPVNSDGNFVLPLEGVFPMPTPDPIMTGTQPSGTGDMLGVLFLRGSLIAVFPNRGRARTAARYLNRFLRKLPNALEVSVGGMSQGILDYLADAATGKGVDKKPVRLGT